MTEALPPLELSRPLAIERILAPNQEMVVQADAVECGAIAARLDIPAVAELSCRFELTRVTDGRAGEILVRGLLAAKVTRICVVTLDEFPVRVREHFQIRFVPAGLENEGDDFEADDEIPYEGVSIDLGEAAVEQLALSLDPYPRQPGAVLPDVATDAEEGPFAALARLAAKPRGEG
jgi:uncharacterized metal-binding protein YceD (DUF177 family)